MSIRVIGSLFPCTLQDAGRQGFRAFGVPVSGPMDPYSFRLANLLCGNPADAVSLEITLHGLLLRFEEDMLVALCGGGSVPVVDGDAVDRFRPLLVRSGTLMAFKPSARGCRMYLAVAGGFRADRMMGSASTYLPAAFGGFGGRAVKKGDLLRRNVAPGALSSRMLNAMEAGTVGTRSASWGSDPFSWLMDSDGLMRFLPGPEWSAFSVTSRLQFETDTFYITDHSDRMGCQLKGPALGHVLPGEMLSTGVCPGTVQVTHAGVPIILMADGQTTGGYPRMAQVISADLPICGQRRPGSSVRFRQVTMSEAHELYRSRMGLLQRVEQSIRMRFGL